MTNAEDLERSFRILAERAVLACCLLDPPCVLASVARLEADDFADPTCRLVFRAVAYLHKRGEPVNRLKIAKAARANGHELGPDALAALSDTFPVVADLDAYLSAVKEASIRRQVHALLASTTARLASDTRSDPTIGTLQALSRDLEGMARQLDPTPDLDTALDVVGRLLREASEDGTAPEWGFQVLRESLPRLRRGQLVVIGAQTAVGKSIFMAQQAAYQARQGHRVLWIGLEMSRDEVLASLCRAEIGMDPLSMRHWRTAPQPGACEAWADTFDRLAFEVRDDLTTLDGIESAVRVASMGSKRPDIVYIDYIQLVAVAGLSGDGNDEARISRVTRGLKTLGMSTGIPIITASQFNRDVKNHDEPRLDHLRGSGAIEQDANIILLLSRGDKAATMATEHVVRCRVAKFRGGPSGESIPLHWLPAVGALADDTLRTERVDWNGPRGGAWPERVAALRIPA